MPSVLQRSNASTSTSVAMMPARQSFAVFKCLVTSLSECASLRQRATFPTKEEKSHIFPNQGGIQQNCPYLVVKFINRNCSREVYGPGSRLRVLRQGAHP